LPRQICPTTLFDTRRGWLRQVTRRAARSAPISSPFDPERDSVPNCCDPNGFRRQLTDCRISDHRQKSKDVIKGFNTTPKKVPIDQDPLVITQWTTLLRCFCSTRMAV